MTRSPPLHGFLWNQAELPGRDPLHQSLAMLVVTRDDLSLQLIGTAFIVAADGRRATAISAAHCFEEVRKVLHPHSPHHLSTPLEFLPPPKEIDLRRVKALYTKAAEIHACAVELAIWDRATDLAVLNITAPHNDDKFFTTFFWIDDSVPSANDIVAMIGYGNMEAIPDETRQQHGVIKTPAYSTRGNCRGCPSRRILHAGSPMHRDHHSDLQRNERRARCTMGESEYTDSALCFYQPCARATTDR
jgi:hypothetical protein